MLVLQQPHCVLVVDAQRVVARTGRSCGGDGDRRQAGIWLMSTIILRSFKLRAGREPQSPRSPHHGRQTKARAGRDRRSRDRRARTFLLPASSREAPSSMLLDLDGHEAQHVFRQALLCIQLGKRRRQAKVRSISVVSLPVLLDDPVGEGLQSPVLDDRAAACGIEAPLERSTSSSTCCCDQILPGKGNTCSVKRAIVLFAFLRFSRFPAAKASAASQIRRAEKERGKGRSRAEHGR